MKKRTSKCLGSLLALTLGISPMVLFTGCGRPANAGGSGGGTIAVIGQAEGLQFWDDVRDGADAACSELGYNLVYNNATDISDVKGQEDLIDEALKISDLKAIVIAPNSTEALNPKLKEIDESIPVLTIDMDIATTGDHGWDGRKSYIGSNNVSAGAIAGRQAAALMKESSDQGGKILIIGQSKTVQTAQDRIKGFKEELGNNLSMSVNTFAGGGAGASITKSAAQTAAEGEETPEGEEAQAAAPAGGSGTMAEPTVDDLIAATEYTPTGAQSEASDIARQYLENNTKNISLIYTTNESTTLGVCAVVQELGLKDQVKVIGFNASDTEVAYVKDGYLTGTIVQAPYNMGYLGIRYADKAIQNETLSPTVDTGVTYVTFDNVGSDAVQLLLKPAQYIENYNQEQALKDIKNNIDNLGN